MTLRRTPFFEHHKAAGAKLIDFGGWEMPVQYRGILQEHACVRERVGLFDVSHMGEVFVRGPQALAFARWLVTNDVAQPIGKAQYTAMCNERGGIVDDLIVYRLSDEEILICVNAANRDKDHAWMVAHNPMGASLSNESDAWAQVAVQGRHAPATLQKLTDLDLSTVPSFGVARGKLAGVAGCLFARTGYTGEDGFEVFIPVAEAPPVWPAILDAGAEFGIQPIGLGARDTLRLEMKMALYGNDITDDTTPLEANLAWVVKLDKDDFVGKAALVAQKAAGIPRKLVCLEVDERIPRSHMPVQDPSGRVVGEVTSGTRSPTLERNIAMAYVETALAAVGTPLQVDVRGKVAPARVVKSPFYKRPY